MRFLVEYVKLGSDASGLIKFRPTFHTLEFLPGNKENVNSLRDVAEELAAVGFYCDRQKAWILPGSILSVKETR